jgi:hypothetical protein
MAQATSISLSKFTSSVQAAVKSAGEKHPKFNLQPPQAVTVSYLIRGIPVPDGILKAATLAETQAFADAVAAGIASAHPEVFSAAGGPAGGGGAVISAGGHVVIGIPPVTQVFQLEK